MQMVVVHGRGAGGGTVRPEELVALLRRAGHDPRYFADDDPGWRDAVRGPADAVVAAGGDGTVRRVALAARGVAHPVAVLPVGTANNVAAALSISGSIADEIAAWSVDRVRAVDLGVARFAGREEAFLESLGAGAFARVIERHARARGGGRPSGSPEDKVRRDLAELDAAIAAERPAPFRIRADGRDASEDCVLLEVMNLRRIGANLPLASAADPGDGLLDVVRASEADRGALRAYIAARLDGEEARLDLPFVQASQIEIETAAAAAVHVDDSPRQRDGRLLIRITVDRAAVTFLEGSSS
jgi:diacylglycerol kinase family enzyme